METPQRQFVHCYQLIHSHITAPGRMKYVALAVLVYLANAVTEGNARWCYTCTSKRDVRCADPFHANVSSMEHQCTEDSSHSMHAHHMHNMRPVCKKSVRLVYGEEVVLRSCEWDKKTACPSNVDSSSEEIYCATCDSDGCNDARPTLPALGLQLILRVAFWVICIRLIK